MTRPAEAFMGCLRPIPPANTYFTHAETQWEALYEGYETH
jgi:hypothetical protein